MPREITCPECGETEDLGGVRHGDHITVSCGACGRTWDRDLRPLCDTCHGDDMQAVVLAVVERSRGTQLSVVGSRVIHLCTVCDADTLDRYHRNHPNPLMPDELPTVGPEQGFPSE